jgi:hypothetical protein
MTEPMPGDAKLWHKLGLCLEGLLPLQVQDLMQELFKVEELNSLQGESNHDYLAALRRLGRLERLSALLAERYPQVYARFFREEKTPFRRDYFFENREAELNKVFLEQLDTLSHCWLVLGPAGYGKTEFLREIGSRHIQLGWLVSFIKFKEDLTLDAAVRQIGLDLEMAPPEIEAILKKPGRERGWSLSAKSGALKMGEGDRGLLLLFDDLHLAKDSVIRGLVELVEGLFEGWHSLGIHKTRSIRVISSARNLESVDALEILGRDTIRLSPFSFRVIQQSVRNFASRPSVSFVLEPHKVDAVAAYLCHVTGGHPGCLVTLLQEYYGDTLFRGPWPTDEDPRHLGHVFDVIKEIEKSTPPTAGVGNLGTLLERLSVMRKFSAGMLGELAAAGLLASEDPQALWDGLTRTHLVDNQRGFLGDDITRRLFFCRLRSSGEQGRANLRDICQFAVAAYEKRLTDPEIHRGRHTFALELLYHHLQEQFYIFNNRGSGLKDLYLSQILPSTLAALAAIEPLAEHKRGVIDDLLAELQDGDSTDWEFAFTLNYFTSENGYDDSAFAEMLERIKAFRGGLPDPQSATAAGTPPRDQPSAD